MVIDDDLCRQSFSFYRRTEPTLDEIRFLLCLHLHTGIVIRIQRLVLDGHGGDGDTLVLHGLDIVDKVVGIRRIILWQEAASARVMVRLHPGGSGPWRSQYLQRRVQPEYLL